MRRIEIITTILALVGASTLALTQIALTQPSFSQTWPIRPITKVVPFAAGDVSDVIARLVAEGLRAKLGQPVVIENIGGTGGMIGSSRVAKAPPDGYQIVLGNVDTHAHNQSTDRMTPDYLARFVTAEIDKWAVVIQKSGISLE